MILFMMKKMRLFSALLLATTLTLTARADVWQDPKTGVNYEYTVGYSEACVKAGINSDPGSPDVKDDIDILSTFTIDGNEYTVTSIGEQAFYHCSRLTRVHIPEGIIEIGTAAFHSCYNLYKFNIPETTVRIGNNAFYATEWCNKQSGNLCYADGWLLVHKPYGSITGDITIKEGTKRMADMIFYDCSGITSVTIPSSMECISMYGFAFSTGLKSVIISEGLKEIGIQAFDGCSNLTSIIIPEGVKFIGRGAFHRCSSLTSITIPASITGMDLGILGDCGNLQSIIVAADNPVYDSRDNCNAIIETSKNKLCEGCGSTVIPSSVTEIRQAAFSGRTNLKSITIPSSIKKIISYAFYNCTELTSVKSFIKEPIGIDASVFLDSYGNNLPATLYVPYGTAEKYKATYAWNRFESIVEMDEEAGIEGLTDDNGGTVRELYHLDGQRQLELRKGVNIERMSDGTVKKIFVK